MGVRASRGYDPALLDCGGSPMRSFKNDLIGDLDSVGKTLLAFCDDEC